MKTLKTVSLFSIVLLFFSQITIAQEKIEAEIREVEEIEEIEEIKEVKDMDVISKKSQTIKGTFDGFDGDSYSFNYKNEDDDEDTIFFTIITPEVSKMYNLKDKKFIGKFFEVIFASLMEKEVDEDGDEQEFTKRTITGLKLLN